MRALETFFLIVFSLHGLTDLEFYKILETTLYDKNYDVFKNIIGANKQLFCALSLENMKNLQQLARSLSTQEEAQLQPIRYKLHSSTIKKDKTLFILKLLSYGGSIITTGALGYLYAYNFESTHLGWWSGLTVSGLATLSGVIGLLVTKKHFSEKQQELLQSSVKAQESKNTLQKMQNILDFFIEK